MYKLHIFLWKLQKFFRLKQQILNHFSLKNLKPNFCWNWKNIFPLEKSYRKTLKFRGQHSFQLNTMHIATLSVEITRYFETPITIVKPPHYWNSDLKTLIHSEFQTYHPDITEPKNVQFQNMERTNNSIEDNHKHLYQEPATIFLWSLLIRANLSWKWTFKIATLKKNESCTSFFTKTRAGT